MGVWPSLASIGLPHLPMCFAFISMAAAAAPALPRLSWGKGGFRGRCAQGSCRLGPSPTTSPWTFLAAGGGPYLLPLSFPFVSSPYGRMRRPRADRQGGERQLQRALQRRGSSAPVPAAKAAAGVAQGSRDRRWPRAVDLTS